MRAAFEPRTCGVDGGVVLLLLAVLLFHLHVYRNYPYKPVGPGTGWENFWDQGQYLKSAAAFARGDLSADQHWYPPGYSLLAAPFVYLPSAEPFFFVNTACLLLFAGAFVRYFRPLIGLLPSAIAFAVALAWPASSRVAPTARDYPIWVQFVLPWSTIPIAAIYMGILCLLRERPDVRHPRTDVALGVLSALVLAIRPIDALALVPAGLMYLFRRLWTERPLRHIGWAAGVAAVVLMPILGVLVAVHGGLRGPYLAAASAVGMSLSDIHERASDILLSATTTHGTVDTAVFELQPWLFAAFPLALVWGIREWRHGLVPVATALVSLLVYLAFNDLSPVNIMRFSLVHYIVWLLPVVTAAGVAGAVLLVRNQRWMAISAVAVIALALASYRVETNTIVPDLIRVVPAGDLTSYQLLFVPRRELDAIDLAGASAAPLNLQWGHIRILVNDRPLERLSGYRLIPVEGGIRIILNRHVSARRLEFDLGPVIVNHPRSEAMIRCVRFRSTFAPFWRPREMATIG